MQPWDETSIEDTDIVEEEDDDDDKLASASVMVTLMSRMMTARATSMATGSTWWTAGNQRASDVAHPTFTVPAMSHTPVTIRGWRN